MGKGIGEVDVLLRLLDVDEDGVTSSVVLLALVLVGV